MPFFAKINTNALLVSTARINPDNDPVRDLVRPIHDDAKAPAESSSSSNCNTVETSGIPLPDKDLTNTPHNEANGHVLYGVTYVEDLDLYRSQIQINCTNCYAGDYELETDAAAASDVIVKYFTEADSPKYKTPETRRLNFHTADEYKLARETELSKRGLVESRIGVDHSALTLQAVRYIVSFIHESEALTASAILATPSRDNYDKSSESIIVSATKDATANDGTDLSNRSTNTNIENSPCNNKSIDVQGNRRLSQGIDNTDTLFINKTVHADGEISASLGHKESNRHIIKDAKQLSTTCNIGDSNCHDVSISSIEASNYLKRKHSREIESISKRHNARRMQLLGAKNKALEKKW